MNFQKKSISKTHGQLCRDQVIIIVRTGGFLLKAILQLQLDMRSKAVACCQVDPPEILAPANLTTYAVGDVAEELLIPTERAEELRREFVFCLKIVSECIRIAHPRDFEARFVKFRP